MVYVCSTLYHKVACCIVHTIVNRKGVKLTGYCDRAVIDGQMDMYFATLEYGTLVRYIYV